MRASLLPIYADVCGKTSGVKAVLRRQPSVGAGGKPSVSTYRWLLVLLTLVGLVNMSAVQPRAMAGKKMLGRGARNRDPDVEEGDEGTGCRWELKAKLRGERRHWVYSCREGEESADHVSGLLAELDAYSEEPGKQEEEDPMQLLGKVLWQQGGEEEEEEEEAPGASHGAAEMTRAVAEALLAPDARRLMKRLDFRPRGVPLISIQRDWEPATGNCTDGERTTMFCSAVNVSRAAAGSMSPAERGAVINSSQEDGHRGSVETMAFGISAEVYDLLPRSQPELRYTNCAVVGNGASLGADSAAAIDAADAVLRMNSAPLIPGRTGSKTTFSVLSKAAAERAVRALPDKPAGAEMVLLADAGQAAVRLELFPRLQRALKARGTEVALLSHAFLTQAHDLWSRLRSATVRRGRKGAKFPRSFHVRTGVLGALFMLQVCDNVKVYGVTEWAPKPDAASEDPGPFHYFTEPAAQSQPAGNTSANELPTQLGEDLVMLELLAAEFGIKVDKAKK